MLTAWREFAVFVRAPIMATPVGLRSGWRLAGAMVALQLLGLHVVMLVVGGWEALTGIEYHNLLNDFPTEWIVVAALVVPLFEEAAFRGWLSGRPRALWLSGCLLGFTVLSAFDPEPLVTGVGLLVLLIACPLGWWVLRERERPDWFARHFPVMFFIAAGLFAIWHVFNYATPDLLTLPMVLPQLWAGLIFGFVRVRVGLPASMLVHSLTNGLLVAVALLGR